MYAIGGRLIDILGSKKGLAIMIAWWSISNMLHGFVTSVLGLGVARFLLGLGEVEDFQALQKPFLNGFLQKKDHLLSASLILAPVLVH